MSQRKRLDREGLEFYLLNLLLIYRPLLWVSGVVILLYAIVTFFLYPLGGIIALVAAIFLILITLSFPLTLRVAKLGAWLGTLGEK